MSTFTGQSALQPLQARQRSSASRTSSFRHFALPITSPLSNSHRSRARLLWELLNGDVIGKAKWRNEDVREALDLCLACKGCKADCPVNVDMATYKAEFLSRYYQGRLRPVHAYAFGLIHLWAQLAATMPRLANFFAQTPVLRDVLKWLGGIAPERQMPAFAAQ